MNEKMPQKNIEKVNELLLRENIENFTVENNGDTIKSLI